MCVPSSSVGLVDREALRRRVGELEQRAAGRAAVDGEEVAAVLDVGDVGEAEADDLVLDAQPGSRRCPTSKAWWWIVPSPKCQVPCGRSGSSTSSRIRPWPSSVPISYWWFGAVGAELARRSMPSRRKSSIGSGSRTERRRAVRAADRVLGGDAARLVGLARSSPSRRRSRTGCRTGGRSSAAGCRSARPPRSRSPRRRGGRPRSRSSRPGPTSVERLQLVGAALAHPARPGGRGTRSGSCSRRRRRLA